MPNKLNLTISTQHSEKKKVAVTMASLYMVCNLFSLHRYQQGRN